MVRPGSHQKAELIESNSQEQLISPAINEPLWQRLQNLETVVTQMTNKPRTIPPEKENILQESLSRIKSIEYDLQKTKKVLPLSKDKIGPFEGHIIYRINITMLIEFAISFQALLATASKQVELAESLESLKESRFDVSCYCPSFFSLRT